MVFTEEQGLQQRIFGSRENQVEGAWSHLEAKGSHEVLWVTNNKH